MQQQTALIHDCEQSIIGRLCWFFSSSLDKSCKQNNIKIGVFGESNSMFGCWMLPPVMFRLFWQHCVGSHKLCIPNGLIYYVFQNKNPGFPPPHSRALRWKPKRTKSILNIFQTKSNYWSCHFCSNFKLFKRLNRTRHNCRPKKAFRIHLTWNRLLLSLLLLKNKYLYCDFRHYFTLQQPLAFVAKLFNFPIELAR